MMTTYPKYIWPPFTQYTDQLYLIKYKYTLYLLKNLKNQYLLELQYELANDLRQNTSYAESIFVQEKASKVCIMLKYDNLSQYLLPYCIPSDNPDAFMNFVKAYSSIYTTQFQLLKEMDPWLYRPGVVGSTELPPTKTEIDLWNLNQFDFMYTTQYKNMLDEVHSEYELTFQHLAPDVEQPNKVHSKYLMKLFDYYKDECPQFMPARWALYETFHQLRKYHWRYLTFLEKFEQRQQEGKVIDNATLFQKFLQPYQDRVLGSNYFYYSSVFNLKPLLAKLASGTLTEKDLYQISLETDKDFSTILEQLLSLPQALQPKEKVINLLNLDNTNSSFPSLHQVVLTESNEKQLPLPLDLSLYSTHLETKEFIICLISGLFFMTLGGCLCLRDRLMKVLILLEVLLLGIVVGFTIVKSLEYQAAGQLVIAILILSLAACEAVLGLSAIISRTRVLATFLTTTSTKVVNYLKKK